MDRIVRAQVLLAEAASLGVTVDDLVAASADIRGPTTTKVTGQRRSPTSWVRAVPLAEGIVRTCTIPLRRARVNVASTEESGDGATGTKSLGSHASV